MKRQASLALAAALSASVLVGCPQVNSPGSSRPPKAQKWFERGQREFRAVRIDAAGESLREALELVPQDEEVRVLAARVALARLEFDEALRLLRGVQTSDARGLRARAYWYLGDVEKASGEFDSLLEDPEVDDPWATQTAKLAARGAGRKPFDIVTTNGSLERVEMAKVAGASLYVVPVEIDGESGLTLVATGTSEVMLDSSTRSEPSWVSMRFGKRLEVRDVPALTQDLTRYSMQLGAPVKALLGANLLRHLNVTLDLAGRQFVARKFSPHPPRVASRVDVWYLRGGGMVLPGTFGEDKSTRFFVDTSLTYNLALDREAWSKVGLSLDSLQPLPTPPGATAGPANQWREGTVPMIQIGAWSFPQLPAVYGSAVDRVDRELDVDVDGMLGAGLLANFRLTFTERGRVLWVEKRPTPEPSRGPLPVAPPPGGLEAPDIRENKGGSPLGGSDLLSPGLDQGPPLNAPVTP